MKIFDLKDNKVIISAEVLTVPQFEVIYKQDKSKDKIDAYKQFGYIYHICDWNSPYANYPDKRKEELVKADFLGGKDFVITDEIKEAIKKYRELAETPKQRLLQAAKNKIDGLATFMNETEVTVETSDSVLKVFKDISTTISNFDKLEDAVKKEKESHSERNRGGQIVNSMNE